MASDTDNQNWDLLGRYMAGEASPAEEAAARELLRTTPSDERFLDLVNATAPDLGPRHVSQIELEAAWRKAARARSTAMRRWPAVAAAAVLATVGILGVLRLRSDAAAGAVALMLRTGPAEIDTLTLDDGSRVILAPNSALSIAEGYGDSHREARLEGEAVFTVAHRGEHAFTVLAGDARVVDIGTEFDVDVLDDASVVVEVVSGAVRASAVDEPGQGVTVQEGERARVQRGQRTLAERTPATATATAWTSGRLIFRNADLAEVRRELRRWYGIDLQVGDSALARKHLNATFQREPVDEVLHVIALTLGATVERRGNSYILHTAPNSARQ